MKKQILFIALFSAIMCALIIAGCKKKSNSPAPSYSCTACATTPEAKAANDNTSKGIYKGIVVGSSGTIKFDIMNNDSTIKAYMVIDSVYDTLTASVAWVSGASYVSPFTGTLNGQPITITFSIDANGGNPTVTSMDIPGHPNATLSVSKETSNDLIECFEGTIQDITTGETGTMNLILSTSLKKWGAVVKTTSNTSSSSVNGVINGNVLSFDDGQGSTGSATLSGDQLINGTWKNTKPENGTWSGKRTM